MNTIKKIGIICLFLFSLFFSVRSIGLADETGDIVVSAQVEPNSSEFQLEITSNVDSLTLIPENTEITYQITYGSSLSYATNLTIEADWDGGFIVDEGNIPVYILDYVAGSATNGYGDAVPVIDLVNRKIIWTIYNIPTDTIDQVVTFKLKTNDNYQGTSVVNFSVSGIMTVNDLQVPTVSASNKYKHSTIPVSEEEDSDDDNDGSDEGEDQTSETATPSTNIVSSPNQPVIGSPVEGYFSFINIELHEVFSDSISFEVELNQPAQIEILYGTSPNKITQSIKFNKYETIHYPKITELKSGTTYYFIIKAVNTSKSSIKSDVYIVKTPIEGETPIIRQESIIVTSNKNILHDTFSGKNNSFVVIPKNQAFEFKFGVSKGNAVERIDIRIREASSSDKVLGIRTKNLDGFYQANEITAFEINPGYYFGKIKSPSVSGLYVVLGKIYDINGAVVETKLFDLKVIDNLKVLDENNIPIEDAQVHLYVWNFRENNYEKLKSNIFSMNNPLYTDINGEIAPVLPQNMYSAEILAIGYENQSVQFELGPYNGQEYPKIILKKAPFNFINILKYYWTIIVDVFNSSIYYGEILSHSSRFYKINAVFSIFSFLILLAHILLTKFRNSFNNGVIKGFVFDKETNKSLSQAIIIVLDSSDRIVNHALTKEDGSFIVNIFNRNEYRIEIFLDGYEAIEQNIINDELLNIYLDKNISIMHKFNFKDYLRRTGLMAFEFFLITVFIFELFLLSAFGFVKIWPFFAISLLNLIIWSMYKFKIKKLENHGKI
jgi:hypothetical protein